MKRLRIYKHLRVAPETSSFVGLVDFVGMRVRVRLEQVTDGRTIIAGWLESELLLIASEALLVSTCVLELRRRGCLLVRMLLPILH